MNFKAVKDREKKKANETNVTPPKVKAEEKRMEETAERKQKLMLKMETYGPESSVLSGTYELSLESVLEAAVNDPLDVKKDSMKGIENEILKINDRNVSPPKVRAEEKRLEETAERKKKLTQKLETESSVLKGTYELNIESVLEDDPVDVKKDSIEGLEKEFFKSVNIDRFEDSSSENMRYDTSSISTIRSGDDQHLQSPACCQKYKTTDPEFYERLEEYDFQECDLAEVICVYRPPEHKSLYPCKDHERCVKQLDLPRYDYSNETLESVASSSHQGELRKQIMYTYVKDSADQCKFEGVDQASLTVQSSLLNKSIKDSADQCKFEGVDQASLTVQSSLLDENDDRSESHKYLSIKSDVPSSVNDQFLECLSDVYTDPWTEGTSSETTLYMDPKQEEND